MAEPGITRAEVAACIDHTLLKPGATVRELDELCSQAVRFGFSTGCASIPP